MKYVSTSFWLALAMLCGSLCAQEPINWQADISAARKASQQWGVPILLHFYGDNCPPCKALEQQIYTRPEVSSAINMYFIPVKINATVDRQTAAEFGVHSWPTDVFISPDGKTLSQGVSPAGSNHYLENLQKIAIMNRDRRIMLAAEKSRSGPMASKTTNSLPDNKTPYGQLAATTTAQPPAYMSQQGQAPNTFAASGQAAASQNASALPPLGTVTASSPLAGQIARSQTTTNFSNQTANVQRGPLDVRTQPVATNGAVSGPTNQFALPNVPAQQTIQPQLAGQSKSGVASSPWQTQANASPAAPAANAGGMPNMVASQNAAHQTGQPAASANAQPRGLLVSNPHYQPASNQEVATNRNDVQALSRQPVQGPTEATPQLVNSRTPPNTSLTAVAANPSPSSSVELNSVVLNPTLPNATAPHSTNTVAPSASNNPAPNSTHTTAPNSTTPSSQAANPVALSPSTTQQKPTPAPIFQANNERAFEQTVSPASPPITTADSPAPAFQPVASHARNAPAGGVPPAETHVAPADIACEGYCPVSLIHSQERILGRREYAVKHRGQVYHLSSQSALNAFLASPDSYAPVLYGFDPMIFLEEGQLVRGSFEFGAIDLKTHAIYLFSGQASKDKFAENLEDNAKALNIVLSKARAATAR